MFSLTAANGNVVIVQLLCEHKCPVNLKDMVCTKSYLVFWGHCFCLFFCGFIFLTSINFHETDVNVVRKVPFTSPYFIITIQGPVVYLKHVQ